VLVVKETAVFHASATGTGFMPSDSIRWFCMRSSRYTAKTDMIENASMLRR